MRSIAISLALSLLGAAPVLAQSTAYPGSGCEARGKADVRTELGARVVFDGSQGGRIALVCPTATLEGSAIKHARIHLATFDENLCTVKTLDATGSLVLATSALFTPPGSVVSGPTGSWDRKVLHEVAIPHRSTASGGDIRVIVCELPTAGAEFSTSVFDIQWIAAEIRSYATHPAPGGFTLLDRIGVIEAGFEAQGVDGGWAGEREDQIAEAAEGIDGEIPIEAVECRETLCRVELGPLAEDALAAFESAVARPEDDGIVELLRQRDDESGSARIFVSRAGTSLPGHD